MNTRKLRRYFLYCRKAILKEFPYAVLVFFLVGILHYSWVRYFSEACLGETYSNFRTEYIQHVNHTESIKVLLEKARNDLGASFIDVNLYTEDYNYFIQYTTAFNRQFIRNTDTSLVPVDGDDFYSIQYEDHYFQRCFEATGDEITNPRAKTIIADDFPTTQMISCPLIDRNNFVIGNTTVYFDKNDGVKNLQTSKRRLRSFTYNIEELIEQENI